MFSESLLTQLKNVDTFKKDIDNELARRNILDFATQIMLDFEPTPFHVFYYKVLQMFAEGKLKKLIVTVPPQHGKSQGSSRFMPAYMLGRNPNLKIALASYSGTHAQKFNRAVQRIIESQRYKEVFPETTLSQSTALDRMTWSRNTMEFDIVGFNGFFKAVGRGGQLTGDPVDVMILDDLYKDYAEANSPVVREAVWDFYVNVVRSRTHNKTQELIVFTRWHEDDMIAKLQEIEPYVEIESFSDIDNLSHRAWAKINFEAIKESPPTEVDPRKLNEVLWANRHSYESLLDKRTLDSNRFECLYQGNPAPKEGLLYDDFEVYEQLPPTFGNGNYTDTADSGDDFLCSISYRKGKDKIYITDIVYTQDNMNETEKMLPLMFERSDTRYSRIESNSGGRYFATKVAAKTKAKVSWFHQSKNKESRILTNAATVNQTIVMPYDWKQRWPLFASHVQKYKRLFRANKYHDAPDVLTGIVEHEKMRKKGSLRRRA